MKRAYRAIAVGVALLASSIILDFVGSSLGSIFVLILSFALGIAGAVVSIRGVIEFLTEVM